MNEYMKMAIVKANEGISKEEGGPFGAVIVSKNGDVISCANNKTLLDKDPTAHAEIVAIREACKILNTNDLSEYVLYTSCEPCPMCLSAIIWANIKEVYFGCTKNDAADIGFRDKAIYDFIEGKNEMITLQQIDREPCLKIMKKYNGHIY